MCIVTVLFHPFIAKLMFWICEYIFRNSHYFSVKLLNKLNSQHQGIESGQIVHVWMLPWLHTVKIVRSLSSLSLKRLIMKNFMRCYSKFTINFNKPILIMGTIMEKPMVGQLTAVSVKSNIHSQSFKVFIWSLSKLVTIFIGIISLQTLIACHLWQFWCKALQWNKISEIGLACVDCKMWYSC